MADYYFLLADAIARLPHSTPETRRQLYQRTRQPLLTHLQDSRRPLTTADIEHQLAAFDSAFAEIEVQFAIDAALKTSPPHSGANAPAAREEIILAIPPASPPQRFRDRGAEEPERGDIATIGLRAHIRNNSLKSIFLIVGFPFVLPFVAFCVVFCPLVFSEVSRPFTQPGSPPSPHSS